MIVQNTIDSTNTQYLIPIISAKFKVKATTCWFLAGKGSMDNFELFCEGSRSAQYQPLYVVCTWLLLMDSLRYEVRQVTTKVYTCVTR